MRKKFIRLIIIIGMWGIGTVNATILTQSDDTTPTKIGSSPRTFKAFQQVIPKFLYSYIDFNFNSTINSANYNRFQGHSNLYSIGAEGIALYPNLFAGIYVYHINTTVASQVLLAPAGVIESLQSIKNNTLFGHVLKKINHQIFVDFAMAYGQNNVVSQTVITPDLNRGFSKNLNNNWFTAINGLYRKPWKKFVFKGVVGGLYSQIISPATSIVFQSPIPVQKISPLTNKVLFIIENVEINYHLTSIVEPFISGGLIQIAHFSNSRLIVNEPINGSLPQLEMNQNAYKVGAGIDLKTKHFTLKLEQKYYNANKTYTSNLTSVGITWLR